MSPFIAEFLGTAMLVTLGDGVVANVTLNKTKGNNGGLIAITIGWAMAVFVAVLTCKSVEHGANLNPAITIGFAAIGKIEWSVVPAYLAGQLLGAMLGAFLVWLAYRQHFDATEDQATQLGAFATSPSINSPVNNFITELIATFVLIFAALSITKSATPLGSIEAIPVAFIVLGIGLSLGGPTGYAINPARDLGPRIMHALLPIKNKGGSNWSYSWVPVLGPIAGGIIAAFVFQQLMA
jgi:glycerol uptake facilitator protein